MVTETCIHNSATCGPMEFIFGTKVPWANRGSQITLQKNSDLMKTCHANKVSSSLEGLF